MRKAEQVRLDISATTSEIADWEERGAELLRRLGDALAEAREHPELTLEEARKIPEKEISRQRIYRLMRRAR